MHENNFQAILTASKTNYGVDLIRQIMVQNMSTVSFTKPFTQQEPIPEAGIQRAVEILQTGRLHRYNLAEGEAGEASQLEIEYAKWQGVDYCVACTSGGYAIQLALRVCGAVPGDKILANAYTLAPVPGAIHNVAACQYLLILMKIITLI